MSMRVRPSTMFMLASVQTCVLACKQAPPPLVAASPPAAAPRVLTVGLAAPWEISYGPDARLWISERKGRRVTRIDPQTGNRQVALTLSDVLQQSGQDGLLGMALHPRMLQGSGEDFVYLAYTYGSATAPRLKIVRYRYDLDTQTLGQPDTLLSELPASTDHNSGRLRLGPDDTLYYSIGDQGKNQFDHKCQPNQAQVLPTQAQVDARDWSAYEGKILRLSLDGSVPRDNPMLAGVRSHVYSYGHRNVQGLSFGPNGKLYASEHGPKTDDELNLIVAGANYGWPHIAGFRDDRAYVYGDWSRAHPVACQELAYADYELPSAVPAQRESAWPGQAREPLTTFYTVEQLHEPTRPECGINRCWPTVAPSSLETQVVDGQTALLVPTLKDGTVVRVRLDAAGDHVLGAPEPLLRTNNRYRDLTLSPDQQTLYVITDSEPMTSGPTTKSTQQLDHRGAVLVFRMPP